MSVYAKSKKHGKWLKQYKSGVTVSDGFVSSCCDIWNERKTPYCPHCGVKMNDTNQKYIYRPEKLLKNFNEEMLECCEDCSYQYKQYRCDPRPTESTGCSLVDEELGLIDVDEQELA